MRKLIAIVAGGTLAALVASTPVLAHDGGHDSGREFGEHQGFSGHAR